jgi:hypothetical protein
MPQGASQGYSSHMTLAYRKPQSYIGIVAFTTEAIPNSSTFFQLKPVNPNSIYHWIFLPYLLSIQGMDSDEHMALTHWSSVHFLYNV